MHPHLVTLLGEPPAGGTGRAAWCGLALQVEAYRDHHPDRSHDGYSDLVTAIGPRPSPRWVLLYPTDRKWRYSVGEVPEAIGCGALDHIPSNASFEEARTALLRILNSGEWVVPGPLVWEKTDEMGGWSARVEAS